jgi:hypothetical protein
MDLVIPYQQSELADISLKYALRSAALFIQKFDQIVIVGDYPQGFEDIYLIEAKDDPQGRWRERNIYRKIATACMDDSISEDFIYFHDDHFLLDLYEDRLPYYYQDYFEGNDQYKHTVRNTYRAIKNVKNFDVHFPMIINKQRFLNTVCKLDWSIPYGYCIKSAYCAMNNIDGTFYRDLKLRKQYLDVGNLLSYLCTHRWFSIDDTVMNETMIRALEALYPLKTIYEKR